MTGGAKSITLTNGGQGFMTIEGMFRRALCMLSVGSWVAMGTMAQAQEADLLGKSVVGKIEWGVWIDPDGCQHWWADGGTEGYMVPRRDPQTGKPICLKQASCLAESTDAFFATASANLTTEGRRELKAFFTTSDAFSYSVAGHTDSRGSEAYNQTLSEARAKAVADVARSVGAVVESQAGFGETQPVASNDTAEGMALNRRVEVFCKKG
jgi:outer membrane protein OmpA-like peptidoglycan-associated protein